MLENEKLCDWEKLVGNQKFIILKFLFCEKIKLWVM